MVFGESKDGVGGGRVIGNNHKLNIFRESPTKFRRIYEYLVSRVIHGFQE